MHKFDSSVFNRLYPKSYQPYILKKIDIIISFWLFLLSLIVYFKTLNPSVTAGDSGELITSVYNMGASHPPGYPLYGIIGKMFTFLRFSDIGYKMNIFSGISGAIAVLFGYLIQVKLLGFNKKNNQLFSLAVHIPAIAGSLVFAFSKAHWSQAVIAEVYALNVALSAIMFFVMILWYEEVMTYRNEKNELWLAPRMTFLLAFVMGLSITNHQIPIWYIIAWAIFLIPIIFVLISFKGQIFMQQFQRRWVAVFLFLFVCLMSIFLLIISAVNPYILFPKIMQGQYRMVFPQHVPYILTSILCIPIWATCYSIQNYIYKLQVYSSINKTFLQILHIFMIIIILSILAISFRYLDAHSIIICLPLVIMVVYQFFQRNDLHKDFKNNWVDNFIFIFTIAIWLFVFAISIYLYMLIRAKALAPLTEPKPFSWGDTQKLDILANHILRKQYPIGVDDYSNFLGQMKSLVIYHIEQFGLVNFLFGIVGLYYFLKREPIQALYFIFASFLYLFCIVSFINFQVEPRSLETQEVFFVQQFLIYTIFIGFGYQGILDFHTYLFNGNRR